MGLALIFGHLECERGYPYHALGAQQEKEALRQRILNLSTNKLENYSIITELT